MRYVGFLALLLSLALVTRAEAESRRLKDSAFVCVTLSHLEELQAALGAGDERHLVHSQATFSGTAR